MKNATTVIALCAAGVAAVLVGAARPEPARAGARAAPPHIIYVNNASSAGAFAAVIKNGFDAACRQFAVRCTYRSTKNTTFDAKEQTALIDAAIKERPDALMVTDSSPALLNPHIRAAVLAGIPVIIDNSGFGQAGPPTGALTYVGNDEVESGRTAGQLLGESQVHHLLLIAVQKGLELVDQRVAGTLKGFHGKVTTVRVPLADLASAAKIRARISAALRRDRSIDGAFSVGQLLNGPMLAARAALGARGTRMRWGSIDLGPEVVEALQKGRMQFALDQQQWLQGYLPVQFLAFYVRYGFTPPPYIRTGPSVVTPQTIAKYVANAKRGIR
jgi:simple sugar transport system substrate-binding protein